MLIHKMSHGVLYEIATLDNDEKLIYRRGLTLADFTEFDPAEWFVVKDNSTIAKKARLYYPYFDFIELDGQLCDIKRQTASREDIF